MRGLMADRLLKRFLKGIRRKSRITSAKETEPESGTEMMSKANCLEKDQPEGKEAAKDIEKTDAISNQIHQNSGSEMTSGATELPDDLQKNKLKGEAL